MKQMKTIELCRLSTSCFYKLNYFHFLKHFPFLGDSKWQIDANLLTQVLLELEVI